MEQTTKQLRSVRLQLAISLATEPDGDPTVKQQVLKGLCKADPWISRVLATYGVKI